MPSSSTLDWINRPSAGIQVRGEVEDSDERDLLDAGGVVLEVIFDLDYEPGPWSWRLGIDREELPGASEALSQGEFLRGELMWRLIEWRDTRDERRAHAVPRLLRAA
jgi:hypothetical protein